MYLKSVAFTRILTKKILVEIFVQRPGINLAGTMASTGE
jgi:hypothetical protein